MLADMSEKSYLMIQEGRSEFEGNACSQSFYYIDYENLKKVHSSVFIM